MHASVCLQLCYLLIPNDRVGCVKCGPGDGIQFQRSHNHILHDARVTADAEVSSASRSWRLKPRPGQSLSPATLKRADRPGHSPMPHLATYPWSQGGEPPEPGEFSTRPRRQPNDDKLRPTAKHASRAITVLQAAESTHTIRPASAVGLCHRTLTHANSPARYFCVSN